MLYHPKITKAQFNDVMAHLAWVSEDTLEKGRRLDREELLEYARKILDMAGIDYTSFHCHARYDDEVESNG